MLVAFVDVYGGVANGSCEKFVLAELYVSAVSEVLFREAVVDEIQFMAVFAHAHAEVVGFYVAVDVASLVEVLEGAEHLVEQEEARFEGEVFFGHHYF